MGSRLLRPIWTHLWRHQNIAEFLPKLLEILGMLVDFVYMILPRNSCQGYQDLF